MTKAIIIPDGQEQKFRRILITPFDGIDAVQLKSGEWFINESDYKRLSENLTVTKTEVKDSKPTEATYNIKTELSKLSIRTLTKTDFKETEMIEGEKSVKQ